jgi:hypothetical protein
MEPEEPRQNRTVVKAAAFLAAYMSCCSVTEAARAAGIDPRRHYAWLEKYPKYKAEFEKAKPIAAQWLKDKAVEFAINGWKEPVIYQGKLCYDEDGNQIFIHRRDSGLHQQLNRALLPEFAAKVEHSGPDGGPIQSTVEVIFVNAKAPEPAAAPPA